MIEFLEYINEMSTAQFVFLCVCVFCVTLILCFFLRIFWNRKGGDKKD